MNWNLKSEPDESPSRDILFSLIHEYYKPVKTEKCSNCEGAEIASIHNEKSLFKAAQCFMHNCNWCKTTFLSSTTTQ